MRVAVSIAALLAACGGGSDGLCEVDPDCGGDLACARNGECLPPSEIRSIRISWTIRGQPPNSALCAQTPDLYLMFFGSQVGDEFGYSPVPCEAGLFVMDKLSRRFVSVEIGAANRFQTEKAIDAQGTVSFDLMP